MEKNGRKIAKIFVKWYTEYHHYGHDAAAEFVEFAMLICDKDAHLASP